MNTQQEMIGNWNQLKGLIRERWGQLTDDELQEVRGDFDQLVGLIQEKTGQARVQIERSIDELCQQSTGVLDSARERAREYVGQVSENFSEVAGQASERINEKIGEAEALVKRRPAESVAVAFGTGLIAGVIVGLVCRSR